jgi:hypothetical protein
MDQGLGSCIVQLFAVNVTYLDPADVIERNDPEWTDLMKDIEIYYTGVS